MTTQDPSAETAEGQEPEAASRANAATFLLVLLVLVSAIFVPYVGARFGWSWGVVAWAGGAGVLILALRFGPHGPFPGGFATRLINWLAIASPQVSQYLDRIEETERVNAENAAARSNMTTLIASYGLPGNGAPIPDLATRDHTADERASRINLADLSYAASEAVAVAAPEFDGRQPQLATCLAVLYCDQFEHAHENDVNELDKRWTENRTSLIELLAGLMARHAVFEFSGHEAPQIAAALRNLRHFGLPTLAAVVEQLKQSPAQIVSNMGVITREFGFDIIDHDEWDDIAAQVTGVSYAGLPRAVATRFAKLSVSKPDCDRVATQLELLYRDRFDRTNEALWARFQDSPQLRDALASRLAEFGPLAPEVTGSSRTVLLARGRMCRLIRAMLDSLDTFDLDLLQAALARVEMFWKLTTDYADDLAERGLPKSRAFEGPVASKRFVNYLVDHEALPRSEAAPGSLDDARLVHRLLVQVAEESIGAHGCADEGEAARVTRRLDVTALATVSVGRYLMGDGGRPQTAAALARDSHRDDGVIAVLLAALWQRRTRIDAGQSGKVPLAELVCEHLQWHTQAKEEFGVGLCKDLDAAIAAQLVRGEWPTQLPLDWMFQRFARKIIAESRSDDPASAKKIDSIKGKVSLLAASTNQIPQHLGLLVDRLNHFDPRAGDAERDQKLDDVIRALGQVEERTLEELTVAVKDLQRIDLEMQDEVGRTVHDLEVVDTNIARSVDDLIDTDQELKVAVDRLLNAVPATAGTYLITWPARSGRMSDLMADLAKPNATGELVGRYDWIVDHPTPYARLGKLPAGVSFDEFCEHLRTDLATVHEHRQEREPQVWDDKHAHVYVQQIANRIDQHVS